MEDILSVLETGLKKNYAEVSVEIVPCPDLSRAPYHLAAKGLCGATSLADVGGVPYLAPGPAQWRERVYNLDHTASQVNNPGRDGKWDGKRDSFPSPLHFFIPNPRRACYWRRSRV